MNVPKSFKKLDEPGRIKYAVKKKNEYEKKADQWAVICRKLISDKDFTPLEMDIIDAVLDKEV